MTPLAKRLARMIAQTGPMPMDEVMRTALLDPKDGYYTTKQAFSEDGATDFLTAPEVSQMFGESLGVWARLWFEANGRPDRFDLIELGPGRGVLMRDLLRASDRDRRFENSRRLTLVEASPALKSLQRATLGDIILTHADRLPLRGDRPALIIANEFLDCLGVRQFAKTPDGWRERVLALTAEGQLSFALSGPAPPRLIPDKHQSAPEGSIFETSPASAGAVGLIAERLLAAGGAAILIDYGPATSDLGDTLQAIRGHQKVDPLATLGEADLTARVDFEAVGRSAADVGLAVYGPLEQGRLLVALGVEARAKALAAANPEQADTIARQLQRLAAPDQMGALFKVICLTPKDAPPPPVFASPANPSNAAR